MNETVNKAQRHGRDKFVEINKWNSEMNVQKGGRENEQCNKMEQYNETTCSMIKLQIRMIWKSHVNEIR